MWPLGGGLRGALGAGRACAPPSSAPGAGGGPACGVGAPTGSGGARGRPRGARGSFPAAGAAGGRSRTLGQPHRPRAARSICAEGKRMISTVEKVLFLKSIDLFRTLPSEELAQIAEIAEEQPLAAGDQIFAQGETGDALYLIVEGKVKVHQGSKELVRLGERDVFGSMSVLDA